MTSVDGLQLKSIRVTLIAKQKYFQICKCMSDINQIKIFSREKSNQKVNSIIVTVTFARR